jgi:hypothetical protein
MLALLYREGQQREVAEGQLQVRIMRNSIAEGVADVLVPMMTGKARRRPAGDDVAPSATGLTGAALTRAVGLLGTTMGRGPNHPGLVAHGTPGHPYRQSVH